MSDPDWMDAQAAAESLGVKRATLYAYVSRGLVASRRTGTGRERQYRREDLEGLRNRGRTPSTGGDSDRALRWGDPVLESSVTEMTADGPAYRGHLATGLADEGVSFERVAELLWTGNLPDAEIEWSIDASASSPDFDELAGLLPPEATPHSVLSTVLALAAARDPERHDTAAEGVFARARHVIRLLAASLALPGSPRRAARAYRAGSIAGVVARSLGAPCDAVPALNRALILLADHELNASTFANRVVASTGADVYACLQAGMAALSGPLHGAATDRVEALLQEAGEPGRATKALQERMRRGERIPGFGHPFYPDGDPRARSLFEVAWERSPRTEALKTMDAIVGAMERAGRPHANVDVGLVALRAALSLPVGCAASLFCVGRSAGWVAHALEQADSGHLVRPRAGDRDA